MNGKRAAAIAAIFAATTIAWATLGATTMIRFRFLSEQAAFDNVLIHLNGKRQYAGGNLVDRVVIPVKLKPGQSAELQVSYSSHGLDTWHY